MNAPPLTHHDVLAIAEPFARAGWRCDLAASRRDERRLVFTSADEGAGTLLLQDHGTGRWSLTRTVHSAEAGAATLRADGRDPAALLAQVRAVPPARHFSGPAARDYVATEGAPRLEQGRVRTGGFVFTLLVPVYRRAAATIHLQAEGGGTVRLPEDLLAVQGWNWARLVPARDGWTSRVRLRAADRTARAEALLDQAAAHLVRTFAEPPAAYHARHARARWAVFLRRGIPTFTAIGLVIAVLLSARFDFRPSTTTLMLLYHVPTLIIAGAFLLQELPRFELPPLPRRLGAASWG